MSFVSLAQEGELDAHLAGGGRMVVLFYLPNCPFCIRFRPAFSTWATARDGKMACLEVPLTYESPAWERYDMEAVPAVLVFAQGQVVHRLDARPGVGLEAADLNRLFAMTTDRPDRPGSAPAWRRRNRWSRRQHEQI